MRKILIFTLLLLSIVPASGQNFKIFIDMFGGISLNKGVTAGSRQEGWDENISDLRPFVAFGLNFTEGYQINRMWFAGLGVGASTTLDRYKDSYYESDQYYTYFFPSIMLPVYADVRWTYDRDQRVKPFVDLKLGYQFNVEMTDGLINYRDEENLFVKSVSGFYFQPTIGVRFGGSTGFNLGLSYNPTIRQKLFQGENIKQLSPINTLTGGALMLSWGIDF